MVSKVLGVGKKKIMKSLFFFNECLYQKVTLPTVLTICSVTFSSLAGLNHIMYRKKIF